VSGIAKFRLFLEKLGGLHDARVLQFTFDATQRVLRMEIDDIFSNFEGLPEYTEPRPGKIVLHQISDVTISLQSNTGPLNIYEFSIVPDESKGGSVSLKFWPQGTIQLRCDSAEFPDLT
jgi:hypothetical protein